MDPTPEPAREGGPAAPRIDGEAQYVTFRLGDEVFALPMESVREIIRNPDVVRVPMTPPAFEGVANLRGQVLPVVNLRRRLGLEPRTRDDATRVVVVDEGDAVGFVVDSVASVITATSQQHEAVGQLPAGFDAAMLRSMIKGLSGGGIALVLDVPSLIKSGSGRARARAAAVDAPLGTHDDGVSEAQAIAERHLVSFLVDGEEYAFDIDRVQEIVQLPGTLTRVPSAPSQVLGVMTLRDQLVPLVGVRALFGLAHEAHEGERVVIASVGGGVVGFVTDSVKEVLRVQVSAVEPVPALLNARRDGAIDAICRLDQGKRLVSVLSIDALLADQAVAQATRTEQGPSVNDTHRTDETAAQEEHQLVVFQLADVEYGVEIDQVQEIIRLPESITRVPNAPPSVAGVVNVRGDVLPIIDFRARFQLGAVARDDRQRVVIFSLGGRRAGFIVDSVSQVLKVPHAQLEALPAVTDAETARAVRGVANLERHKRLVLVLEPRQLLSDTELAGLDAPMARAA